MSDTTPSICLWGREKIVLSGVKEIVGFDEYGARVLTELGELCIEGEQIKIKELKSDKAEAQIFGKIYSVSYTEPRAQRGKGIKARLFG